MIGQHFDGIWEYINAVTDVTDRRDRLDEGISKDLLTMRLTEIQKPFGLNMDKKLCTTMYPMKSPSPVL